LLLEIVFAIFAETIYFWEDIPYMNCFYIFQFLLFAFL